MHKVSNININVTSTRSSAHIDMVSQKVEVASTLTSVASVAENGHVISEHIRQNIPTKKQFVDPFRQGFIIEGGVGYRQTIVVRSYEVGPDKTATLESILNLLQVRNKSAWKPYLFHAHLYYMHKNMREAHKDLMSSYLRLIIFL